MYRHVERHSPEQYWCQGQYLLLMGFYLCQNDVVEPQSMLVKLVLTHNVDLFCLYNYTNGPETMFISHSLCLHVMLLDHVVEYVVSLNSFPLQLRPVTCHLFLRSCYALLLQTVVFTCCHLMFPPAVILVVTSCHYALLLHLYLLSVVISLELLEVFALFCVWCSNSNSHCFWLLISIFSGLTSFAPLQSAHQHCCQNETIYTLLLFQVLFENKSPGGQLPPALCFDGTFSFSAIKMCTKWLQLLNFSPFSNVNLWWCDDFTACNKHRPDIYFHWF